MSRGLSIIIVSYKNQSVLVNCLDSVFKMNDIDDALQVIVVEQSPTNDIFQFLLQNYPQVDVIRAKNKGFGAGNNRGAEIARHEYLLLLNPDTVIMEPIAAFALSKFESDPKLGLFGVQLLNGDGTKGSSFQCIVPYGLRAKIKYKVASKTGKFSSHDMYIEGADMFVRRELFQKVGGFDESVFMYCEESHLCLAVSRQGYTVAFDGAKKIMHLQGACSPDNYGTTFERQLRSFRKLCSKYDIPLNRIMAAERRYQNAKRFLLRCIGRQSSDTYRIATEKIAVMDKIKESK